MRIYESFLIFGQRLVARGASAEVWSASWRRQKVRVTEFHRISCMFQVAVKKMFVLQLNDSAASPIFKEFLSECQVMRY